MGAERVIFHRASPRAIDFLRTLAAGTDTVLPMIVVGKATTGPAQYGDMEFFQGTDNIVAVTVGVRDRGAFAYPKATVDAGAEVFSKLSVDVTVDDILAL